MHGVLSTDHVAASRTIRPGRSCRFCGRELSHVVADLGKSPLCETFLAPEELAEMEPFYPLVAYVCDGCYLVQVLEHVDGEAIFNESYPYFSSFSDSWLQHAQRYVDMAIERFDLSDNSNVVEIASNDGYLLRNFVRKGIPAYGVEPASNVAETAEKQGVPTVVKFFGEATAEELAEERGQADLIIGNNVLAHVPDLNDFVRGLRVLLAPRGVVTLEFPHLQRLIEGNQFDTIYQEHYCYFSLLAVARVFEHHAMRIFDVEELPTHGGSLRIFVEHRGDDRRQVEDSVAELVRREELAGLNDLRTYSAFSQAVVNVKNELLDFLIGARRAGKRVAGYGAPGKGNTLLNYCGIRKDLVEFVVDRNPNKHGRFLPGSHIPIFAPEKIDEEKPDYVLILPWNLREEITAQLAYVRQWGAKFVVPIPALEVF